MRENQRHTSRVSVLGLGRMGAPIARTLLAQGHHVTVWNRTPERAEPLVRDGARVAGTVAEAVSDGELVLVTLLDHEAARDTLARAGERLRDRVVVNLTTSTPQQARELAGQVAGHGAQYLDGAMLGLPETVGTTEAFFLYSGDAEAFARHHAVLELLAPAHHLGTDPGLAEFEDLALLGGGYATLAGFVHSAALLASVGRRASEFVPLLSRWLTGLLAFLPELAREIDAGAYADGASTVAMNRTAVAGLVEVSRAQGVPPGPHAALLDLLTRREAEGHGGDSFASVVEPLRRPGPPVG
ncbi:NAD(P)-dependent oxidoreductase [Streptomyces boluensis]|uniref:NAD(P)-binding domain-containing protein n=1 Tax=Streptomyces boluensis TaxID=1775135 RepID=A0A964UTG2_9ACTN|nr:NAD(P)-binding domain-containing protein [Streptomyces boluensis]NBE55128.1 NAD(P)-binding domain-containing protein [Streptomyces boluensis]